MGCPAAAVGPRSEDGWHARHTAAERECRRVGQEHQQREQQRGNGCGSHTGIRNWAELFVAGRDGAPLQRQQQQQPEEGQAVGEPKQAQQQQRNCEGEGWEGSVEREEASLQRVRGGQGRA